MIPQQPLHNNTINFTQNNRLERHKAFSPVHKVVEMILKIANYLYYCFGKQAIEKQVLSTLPISFIFLLLPSAHLRSIQPRDLHSLPAANAKTTSCNTNYRYESSFTRWGIGSSPQGQKGLVLIGPISTTVQKRENLLRNVWISRQVHIFLSKLWSLLLAL